MTEEGLIDSLNHIAACLERKECLNLSTEQIMRYAAMQLRATARCLVEHPLERSPRAVSELVREAIELL